MTRHPSFPATLSVDWSGGTSYNKIGQPRDIEGPSITRNQIDIPPDHDQSNNFLNFFAGMVDGGELSVPLNLDPNDSTHVGAAGTGLLGSFSQDYSCANMPAWQFQVSGMCGGTATWTFDGFVTTFEPNMGMVEGHMQADITIKVDGEPTLTIT